MTIFEKGHIPWNKDLKGTHFSPKTEFKKGYIPWIKGREMPKGETAYHWKGNNVGYSALHKWIIGLFGKPNICWNCGDENAVGYDWANIGIEYKRDINDWARLCKKCHWKLDQPWVNRSRDYLGRFI